jgi:hypothetical protein
MYVSFKWIRAGQVWVGGLEYPVKSDYDVFNVLFPCLQRLRRSVMLLQDAHYLVIWFLCLSNMKL